jgi:hypothetical protein
MALYSGDMSTLDPRAPPSFRQTDFQFNPANGFTNESGNQVGSANPFWSSMFGGMDSNNWRWYGNSTDPNQFSLQFKDGPSGGMVYDYTLQNGQYVPTNGREAYMGGNTQYGSDFWVPVAAIAGMAGAGVAAGAGLGGAGAGSGSGAVAGGAGGTGLGGGTTVGNIAAPTVGSTGLGGGAGAGAAAPAAGGSLGDLFGGMKGSDVVQAATGLGSLFGGHGSSGGAASSNTPSNPLVPLSQLGYGLGAPSSMFGPSALAGIPPQYSRAGSMPASALWQQYSSQLSNPFYQRMAAGATPGFAQPAQPLDAAGRPVTRTGPIGG